jgi:hypothetical protein
MRINLSNLMKPSIYCHLLVIGLGFREIAAQDFTPAAAAAHLDAVVNTNGVAVADYDQDGDLDIFFTGLLNFDPSDTKTWNHLMRNNGMGVFDDVTVEAGFGIQYINEGLKAARGEKMGASWGDYDNDGYPDIFLANSRENQLYHNEGNGTFRDVTAQAGVAGCNVCYSATGLWWDHDRDGDLDLYVSNLNTTNVMYQNNGNGTFSDITASTGLSGGSTITWSSVAFDAGKDGFLDLLNVNDTQAKEFFENRTGQRYNEAALAYRLDNKGAGMGVAIGDCNNDGLFDIYITNIFYHLANPLFVDTGNRRYKDQAKEWGVDNTGWGWGTQFLDFDHDGDEDLAAVNGPIDKVNQVIQPDIPNLFFKNRLIEGENRFEDWSIASGTNGLAKGKGLETFDYDGDGDLDMVVANMQEAAYLFKNETLEKGQAETKNWLQINLEGVASNRNAFGTTVKIRIGNQWYHRFHHGAAIFGQSIKPVHFGIGAATLVDEIRFTWPTGITEAIYLVTANQLIKFKEGSGTIVEENNGGNTGGGFIVEKNYSQPNPFDDTTLITFDVATSGTLDLHIFTTMGQEVHHDSKTITSPGSIEFEWDGSGATDGVYFYSAVFQNKRMTGKIIKGK